MTSIPKDVRVLRQGDAEGNGMVLEFVIPTNGHVGAVGVPQGWPSSTGPTWVYLVEAEGLTAIDAGGAGTYGHLKSGLDVLGIRPTDIDRVVVTHGHGDHDGGVGRLVEESGAQFWAHQVYSQLKSLDMWGMEGHSNPIMGPLMRQSMEQMMRGHGPMMGGHGRGSREHPHEDDWRYEELRGRIPVDHAICDGETVGPIRFLHTPGHAPDEICISMDGLLFTGDHVLPQITPHPTVKPDLPEEVKEALSPEFRGEGALHGLEAYLRSLKKVLTLDKTTQVMPAHRLFNRGRFHLRRISRVRDIIRHHAQRLGRIVAKMERGHTDLHAITRSLFAARKLSGGNYFSALSEVVSHVEFLVDCGDVEYIPPDGVRWLGSRNYVARIEELAP